MIHKLDFKVKTGQENKSFPFEQTNKRRMLIIKSYLIQVGTIPIKRGSSLVLT